jgi:ceramide glucosyltransferase
MAWTVGVWGVGDEVLRRRFWLVPLRDALHFVIWLASFGSNHVRWGGVEYVIRQGRMVTLAGGENAAAKSAEDAPRS